MVAHDEFGNPIKSKNIPDAFGRGKDGRIPRGGGVNPAVVKNLVDVGRDPETGQRVYKKVKGGRGLTAAELRQNKKVAELHNKKRKTDEKAAKRARRGR